ncbi:ATP-binding domain-containing protein [Antarcticibacterium sp. 1MA-6-2]|uniref:DEAD/DEAH box helicase n=1 Tax=Antarcticibacterium sp. 1MA-6-2 TaxID=2908210 RepID=UPI001F297CD3|nr:ATP-binding domain-containing protein [Antarcticibacterium sp. 1MA-6-2]UJH92078.1 ATP-binding domain-containing protein [Antarcticibacterium sp. 1MA-6-2]
MKINSREKSYSSNPQALSFINHLKSNESKLDFVESNLYYDFPIFKDFDGDILISQLLIISKSHGIILVSFDDSKNTIKSIDGEFLIQEIEQLHSVIFSRLLRNRNLRKSKTELLFPITSFIFNTNLQADSQLEDLNCISNFSGLESFFEELNNNEISDSKYIELIATIEGANGLLKPKERPHLNDNTKKGLTATEIEKEINTFDEFQKKAFMNEIIGPERIRGLAGSGKTVVLALKAAITHLREPDANIVYTFYTKSLYQHIQRLITRFYRQYDDKDPDWNKLKIVHAWGNATNTGIYYEACEKNEVPFFSFSKAASKDPTHPFDYVCKSLLEVEELEKVYDYMFIDEGQDFPQSFIKLCLRICNKGRIVWAYDELQTIFQVKTPSIDTVLEGTEYKGLEEDIILYKCYRNPREVLVTAHAVGFGIYGEIVQMLDEKDYWNDIGYKVVEGEFKEGDQIIIERPQENSLETISKHFKKNEIVSFNSYRDFEEELTECVKNILDDLSNGLLPDDILVIVVDDRNAKSYLNNIQGLLAAHKIKSNNIHADKFSIKDFSMTNHVTLSTIHKAKGNEAYSVHVVGIDSLYSLKPTIRERNLMFTAMTRTKGWLSLSGVGKSADKWVKELTVALEKFPNIEFEYPSKRALNIMKRDMEAKATRKSKQAKMLDDLLSEMSPDEIKQFLEQREVNKKKK